MCVCLTRQRGNFKLIMLSCINDNYTEVGVRVEMCVRAHPFVLNN